MKPETYTDELAKCDSVIHTVGALLEGVDYKSILNGSTNPLHLLSRLTDSKKNSVPYEESLQAKNRDACKMLAEHFSNACKNKGKGHFVFISAAPTIAPMLSLYIQMKEQAEAFLINNCPNISPVILKPGLVWHENERSWSVPLKIETDIGF